MYEYGKDIGNAIRFLKEPDTNLWKPSMQYSIATVPKAREAENKQFEIQFKAEYNEYHKRIRIYDNNKAAAYALIWERCARGMKDKIEARTEFQAKIYDNPIELLLAIKEHALNFEENRYKMEVAFESIFANITLVFALSVALIPVVIPAKNYESS